MKSFENPSLKHRKTKTKEKKCLSYLTKDSFDEKGKREKFNKMRLWMKLVDELEFFSKWLKVLKLWSLKLCSSLATL